MILELKNFANNTSHFYKKKKKKQSLINVTRLIIIHKFECTLQHQREIEQRKKLEDSVMIILSTKQLVSPKEGLPP